MTPYFQMEKTGTGKSPAAQAGGEYQGNVGNPAIDKSSRQVAQTKRNQTLFGDVVQRDELEEDELGQAKFENRSVQKVAQADLSSGNTGIPASLQTKLENSFNTDFSGVKVHPGSSKAREIGALAYTQGPDIHFAPGQFNPSSSTGQKLLGHELTHVVQQAEGRVQPTGNVNGLALNDNPALEQEADAMGLKAVL